MSEDVKEALKELKIKLGNIYHQRVRHLFLFGSYARGEALPSSDVDVAMIVDDFKNPTDEIKNTSEIVSALSLKNNILISLHPIREKDYLTRKTSLILNLKKEGIPI
ncbi:MAG: nucleotidyltransferase domain-containing protein [bacterium]